jgi:GDP/UDP-N,N'-diacetylbacillosamine 2-epimerase (hydrolysing)
MARKVRIVTGARSEYDLLVPVLEALDRRADVDLGVLAAASHLSPFHGRTVDHIRRDGFRITAEIDSLMASDGDAARCLSFAHLIEGLTRVLQVDAPDLIVVTGDREEALAGALAANFLRIPVAHVHGGDRCIASDIDEVFRPAISKLSHLHLTATEGHRERLIRMGEDPALVFATGAPGLDRFAVAQGERPHDLEVLSEQGLGLGEPFFLIIHHPSPWLSLEQGGHEISAILEGTLRLGNPVYCGYPNSDQGNVVMRKIIDSTQKKNPSLRVFHTLPRREFAVLYRNCSAIVGNSSSLVIESGFVGVPGVLVGDRQKFRETGSNVLAVSAEADAIAGACLRCRDDAEFRQRVRTCGSPYGDGRSGPRIAAILAELPLTSAMLLKTMPW